MLLAALALLLLFLIGVLGATMTISRKVSGLVGLNQSSTYSDTAGVQAQPVSVPAAQPGNLTTHTTNSTGVLTMTNASHGITTGQRIDIFWATGHCYGAVAGTVAGLSVPIASVSGGSNLPAGGTAVTVGIPVAVPFPVTGNNVAALALSMPSTSVGYFAFNDGASDVYVVYVADGLFTWGNKDVAANPLAGVVPTVVYMSHNNTAAAVTTMQAAAITH